MKYLKVFIISLSLLFICNTMFGDGETQDLVRSMKDIERTLSQMNIDRTLSQINKNLDRIATALEKQNLENFGRVKAK